MCSRASWWVQAGSWGRGGARARKAVLEDAPVWPAAGGDQGEGRGRRLEPRADVIIWSRAGPPRLPPGLWLLHAESAVVSPWVLSWGPLERPRAEIWPGGPPEGEGRRAGLDATGRSSLCGTGTGSAGTRWGGARWRRGGRDCGALQAWRLGRDLGQDPGSRSVWDGCPQQWPTLRASAAGAC